ncbi:exodeoxyribonuclease V subunit alpha [Dokdonella sp.]|uniref:exodeoxyribonuclease V subunit alpha n=1 Tax=Dokdonella sp. TaxID=2291710 RepID=UPI002F41C501
MNVPAERALDLGLAQWIRDRTGSDVLARAAQLASAAEGDGHACGRLAAFDAAEIEALRRHAWVGTGDVFRPFVLDGERRFWLWRNWRHEQRLADALLARCAARTRPLADAVLARDAATLFEDGDTERTADQRAALAAVPGARLFVLTGGPGTGKTTTVVRMLLMLLRHAGACGLPERPRIALAAPTGKAAQRLAQAIARGKDDIARHIAGSAFDGLLDAIPHAQAQTLHRLLGYQPSRNRFAYGAEDRLPTDVVVVDEASMVDLATMRQLVEALPASSLLILLGDPEQLASVDAGSVLADVVASATEPASPLRGHVAVLRRVWRAGSDLQRAIEALRDGAAGWTARPGAAEGAMLRACADGAALRACIDAWLERHAAEHARLFSVGIDPAAALALLRGSQVLCALREGRFGAAGVNARVSERLGARHGFDASRTWYHGRPVIVTRNDYARGLFNGDVGITVEDELGLRVWFETTGEEGDAALRSFSPRVLPPCETAWAITIHRSQGSEYDDVAVVLPPDPEHRLLSRELVYTAISRARRRAELWTTPSSLEAAVARRVERLGGLRARLGGPIRPRQGRLF